MTLNTPRSASSQLSSVVAIHPAASPRTRRSSALATATTTATTSASTTIISTTTTTSNTAISTNMIDTNDTIDTNGTNDTNKASSAPFHSSVTIGQRTTTATTTAAISNNTYTRRNAPQRSNVKPRWHTQPYMMFLALRSMPNHTAARQELINAAVALDRKFSAERGLPRVFTGKTPMNSASACLTNNGDKYFVPFKPEGSRSTHFRLAYAPGDFDTAVREYDGWMEKLIKHDWPLCFGVPKEGAVPIHILEQQSRTALEQESSNVPGDQSTTAETTALNDISSALATTIALNGVSSSTDTDSISTLSGATPLEADSVKANGEYPTESKKRSPEPVDTELDKVERSTKKAKAELDSEAVSGADRDLDQDQVGASEQDSKVAERFEQLELKSTSSAASSLPSTPATMTPQEPESASVLESVSASAALVTALAPAPAPLFSAAMVATAKTTKAATPQPDVHRVDEYRLEDLDLTNVPTSLSHVVRVDESTIPNSGNGLFAKIDIPASTPLGFYFGVPMTENEFDSLKDGVGVASHYSIMYRRTVLDATDENGTPYSDPNGRLYCPFHFMNEDPSGNITFITGSVVNQVICQTNRDVKAGEELFVFYGKEVDRFWEKEKEAFRSDTNSDHKKGKTGSRAASPVRREESTTDRPRRNNIYKPARYTR